MPDKQFSMHFDPVGEILAATKACEAAVFLEAYGNTAGQWREEYERYDDASVFISVLEPMGDAVASCRLILPNPVGLKSLVDVEGEPWFVDANRSARGAGMSPVRTLDIATLAARRGTSGGGLLAAALYHGIVAAMRANGFRWVVMIIDARARRLLSMLNLEGYVLPGTMAAPYLGSTASVPIWADVPRLLKVQRQLNPDAYRMINRGFGLEAIALPDAADFVLKPRGLAPAVDFVPPTHDRAVVAAGPPYRPPLSA